MANFSVSSIEFLILHKFLFHMVNHIKLFHLLPFQDGLRLYCLKQELILVYLKVTASGERRPLRQSVWEYA